jgi:uncharacterized protein (DUF2062 family)
MPFPFRKWIPTRQQIIEHRWLQPFAHKLKDKRLWRPEKHAVAKGAAIGVFFGFMIPIAQILLAAIAALMMRANITVAALCTLVTNPFTFPPVYWLAYKIGSFILGAPTEPTDLERLAEEPQVLIPDYEWLQVISHWFERAGLPLMTGLAVLAVVGACLAYSAVHLLWHTRKPIRRAFRK